MGYFSGDTRVVKRASFSWQANYIDGTLCLLKKHRIAAAAIDLEGSLVSCSSVAFASTDYENTARAPRKWYCARQKGRKPSGEEKKKAERMILAPTLL